MAKRQYFLDPPLLDEMEKIMEDSCQNNRTKIFYIGKFNFHQPPNSGTDSSSVSNYLNSAMALSFFLRRELIFVIINLIL